MSSSRSLSCTLSSWARSRSSSRTRAPKVKISQFSGDDVAHSSHHRPSLLPRIDRQPKLRPRSPRHAHSSRYPYGTNPRGRIYRSSNFYNREKAKNLLGVRVAGQLPLIIVCDRFDFVLYVLPNGVTNFIKVCVQRVNSERGQQVVRGPLDVDFHEGSIKSPMRSITRTFLTDDPMNEAEKRNCLKLILLRLEPSFAAGQGILRSTTRWPRSISTATTTPS